MEEIVFRKAGLDDLESIIRLLKDDELGSKREAESDNVKYINAFKLIDQDKNQMLMVACAGEEIVGTCHLTIMPSLTFAGSARLNIEAVRVMSSYRNRRKNDKRSN